MIHALPFSAVFAMLSTVLLCIWHIYKCIWCLQCMLNLIQTLFWCSQMEDRLSSGQKTSSSFCWKTNVGLLFYYCLIRLFETENLWHTLKTKKTVVTKLQVGILTEMFLSGLSNNHAVIQSMHQGQSGVQHLEKEWTGWASDQQTSKCTSWNVLDVLCMF